MDQNLSKATVTMGRLIDLWLPLRIKYGKIPGLSVGIVHKGRLLYKHGFGFADVAKKRKADSTTLYRIASISKTFTAVSIMQLVQSGKLRLDDKIADHISWFKAKNEKSDAAYITIRQLLSHTAGLLRDGDTPHWITGKFPKNLQKTFTSDALVIENLSGFKYTNYGYSILGLIVEKASGMPYIEYVKKHILKPLGMSHTYPDYEDGLTGLATGYGREIPREKIKTFPHYKTNAYMPATGFISSVDDLAKYAAAFSLNEKGSGRILNRASKREMMHPYSDMDKDGKDRYGLGLDVLKIKGRTVVGHSGGFQGFTAGMVFDPRNDLGVIVLTNAVGSSAYQVALGILESIYEIADDKRHSIGTRTSYRSLEGIYRNMLSDNIIAQCGSVLISFSPQAISPVKNARLLKPQKKRNVFVLEGRNFSDSYAEKVVFRDIRNGKAHTVLFGATPSVRI
ncbi:MAG: serine hydrolase domain-containing protein [Minisyncoccota bacterium]